MSVLQWPLYTPSGLRIGTIQNTYESKILKLSYKWLINPSKVWEAGTSPGCTLAVIKIYYFLKS